MFDVSWGETIVIIGISVAAIGRKDLPKASKFIGNKVGKLVGILQGARARADRFAQTNELHALQNELRSGLRELDTVKGELAMAASSQGLIGRGLGSTIPSSSFSRAGDINRGRGLQSTIGGSSVSNANANANANAYNTMPFTPSQAASGGMGSSSSSGAGAGASSLSGSDYLAAAREASESSEYVAVAPTHSKSNLAPRSQSVAAVAEEEWNKRGIGFKSRAERGTGFWHTSEAAASSASASGQAQAIGIGGGSSLLADLIQQNLIHDQYERAVMEQDQEIQDKMDRAEARAEANQKNS